MLFEARQSACYAVYRFFFFFNDTATTEIYTLSLHDALPILFIVVDLPDPDVPMMATNSPSRIVSDTPRRAWTSTDRKSTRLNSSHANISYAVFCLKKKYYTVAGLDNLSNKVHPLRPTV